LYGGRSCCVAQPNLFTDVSSRGHGETALHQIIKSMIINAYATLTLTGVNTWHT
jgi:hypothetical protein